MHRTDPLKAGAIATRATALPTTMSKAISAARRLVAAGLACFVACSLTCLAPPSATAQTTAAPKTAAKEVKLAVASNFLKPIRALAKKFESETATTVRVSAGSTGKLYAQIKKGAPFDVFLAANAREPARLEAEGDSVAGTRFTYALGRLVLWTQRPGFPPKQLLLDGHYEHIAFANPKLAPYGQAALEVLDKLGIYKAVQPSLIKCENVAQAHQFATVGNVELAFVAYAQIVLAKNKDRGSSWLVPTSHHAKIAQEAILLKAGADNPAATNFLRFLKSEPVREMIVKFGYEVE